MLAVVLFVALNIYGSLSLRSLRLDLTENRQFTLSEGTEQLLAGVEEPITLRLYASRALRDANPFLGSYADRVHDLLRTYAEASGGRIVVEYIDPEPFSPEEDRAVGFGLDPVALDDGATQRLSRHRRHQQHRRRRRAAGALARARGVPGVRPDPDGQQPGQPGQAGRGACSARCRSTAIPAMQYRPWQVMQELRPVLRRAH